MTDTPEAALFAAIIRLAIEDLTSKNEVERYEAYQFIFQERGGWADRRRELFTIMGLDEQSVQARFHDIPAPERPEKRWTSLEVLEVCPDVPFKGAEIVPLTGLRYARLSTRLNHLVELGPLVRINRGVFIRTERHADWLEVASTQLAGASTVIDALRDGPKTVRQIGIALDGEEGVDGITWRLRAAAEAGRVTKEGPLWRLVA